MTPVSEALETYLYAVSSLSPDTLQKYQEQLTLFESYCSARGIYLEQITPKVFREFVEHVGQRINPRSKKPVTPRTISEYAGNIKTFLNWCSTYDDYLGCVKPGQLKAMKRPKIEKKVLGIFTQDELKSLYEACKKSEAQFLIDRDRALISLLVDCGLRATELCTLKIEDVHLSLQDSYIKIMGKGQREREVGVGSRARLDLHRYLRKYRRGANKDEIVFLTYYRRTPLNRCSLDQIIYRLKDISGVKRSGGAHMFRRTFATMYLDKGGSIYDLRLLMGHEHVSTTEVYARNTNQRKARTRAGSVWDSVK